MDGHDLLSLRKAIGEAAFEEAFGSHQKHRAAAYAAALAVQRAVRKGVMPRIGKCICQSCGKQAQCYHHPSYLPDDRLCVVPLCFKCHQRHHKSGMELPPLGIVATPIGIIRIAISTPETQEPADVTA